MKVSVIIPTYNRSHFIQEAIESIFNQDIRDCTIEIIVVDDGSTDNTAQVVKAYGAAVKYIYQENRGAGAARNLGIQIATGEWISFLDSDDRWLPNKLSLQLAVLKKFPNCNIIHSNFYTFDKGGIVIDRGLDYWAKPYSTNGYVDWSKIYSRTYNSADYGIYCKEAPFKIYAGNIFRAQMQGSLGSCWTLLIRRKCLGARIRFAENYSTWEDAWFFCLLAEEYDFLFLDVPLAENRAHRGPRLSQADATTELECEIDICEKIYIPSKSEHRPPDEEIASLLQLLRADLFKEYLKKGMRSEAKKYISLIQSNGGFPNKFEYKIYRIAFLLPFNLIKLMVMFKRYLRKLGNSNG